MPNCKTNLFMAILAIIYACLCHNYGILAIMMAILELSLLFWHFIYTTSYHLSLHLPLGIALPCVPIYLLRQANGQYYYKLHRDKFAKRIGNKRRCHKQFCLVSHSYATLK